MYVITERHKTRYVWLCFNIIGDLPWYVPTIQEEEYTKGYTEPNYPVPAIIIKVGYQPQDDGWQVYPSAYWFVSSKRLCWSFWEKSKNMTIDKAET